jgi:hypothetical protein
MGDTKGMKLTFDDHPRMSNEKVLFLFNELTGMASYTHQFSPEGIDSQILSGFVSAMSSFMGELTGESLSEWKTVYGSNQTLIVELGDWMVGVLAVSRETIEYRSKLRRIIREYETTFKFLKEADGIEGSVFDDFDHYVRRVFVNHRISRRTIIMKAHNWRERLDSFELPSEAFKAAKLLHSAQNGENLGDLAERLDLSLGEIRHIVSLSVWRDLIALLYVPSDDDILLVTEGSTSVLFAPQNPLQILESTLRVVTLLDGRTPLNKLLYTLPSSEKEETLYDLDKLVNLGYLEHISPERTLVLIGECILSNLLAACSDVVGQKQAREFLSRATKKLIAKHPWAGRIRLRNGFHAYCASEETITPGDLDNIYAAIQKVNEEVLSQLANEIALDKAKRIYEHARSQCHDRLGRYIEDVVL